MSDDQPASGRGARTRRATQWRCPDDPEVRTDGSGEESPYEADYPRNAEDLIEARARKRFEAKVEEYGPGRGWRSEPPAAMLGEAGRKLAEAERHVMAERPEEAVTAMADALNYIRFEADARMHWPVEEVEPDA